VRCDGSESVDARVDRVLEMTAEAAHGSDVVVLPELWTTGAFDIDLARANLLGLNAPVVEHMRAIARDQRIWLHMGSVPERQADGAGTNTAVLITPDGSIDSVYRKIHLFGFDGGEAALMSAGGDLVVTSTPLGRTGLATCYDLRFPEMFRHLTDRGAEAFVLCSGWPSRRIEHWRVLARARAIENQAWVIACNEVGTHAGTELGGHSIVIDPLGAVVAEGGSAEEIVRAEVDPAAVDAWRSTFPVLRDRRL
jgi:predicted amidohydrolase